MLTVITAATSEAAQAKLEDYRSYGSGLISMVNSIYNGSRFEDVWLDN